MPTTRRTRRIEAPAERVFSLAADPEHMARWWPGVRRMEGVDEDRFTQVHATRKGRFVRLDFAVIERRPPGGDEGGLFCFAQEIVGTPFERVLRSAETEIAVRQAGGGSEVTITARQRLRGTSRLGGFMIRRATRPKLDEALEGLARVV